MSASETGSSAFTYVLKDKMRILTVDDDPIMREFARVHLSTPTATVETAENAEAALRLLGTAHFDVALVDIDMPGMGGIEMVRLLRNSSRWRELPVIMVTGSDDVVSIDRAFDAGATSFVAKPVNWRLLSYHIRFVMRSARAR